MNAVKGTSYTISNRTDILDKVYGMTPAIANKIAEMYERVQRKKNSAAKELIDLIRIYPYVPQFKNLLSVLYTQQGNITKAGEIHRLITKEHPEYLYGKINLAFEYIYKEEYHMVPEVLGKELKIGSLYPYRKEFNYDEVLTYNKAVLLYFIKTDNEDEAIKRVNMMLDIDAASEQTKWATTQLMIYRMEKGLKRMKKENEERRTVKAISAKVTEETIEKPHFNHAVIEQLYCNSMRIPHAIISEILSLPKETLLRDLHAVVYDSIARFKYFEENTTSEYTTHEFLTHALFLIGELQSLESLPVVLDMLRQDKDYLEYWFGDGFSEIAEECIFSLGLHQTDKLLAFLIEPDRHTYARSSVSEAVAQIALHYPERREEVLNWFDDAFKFFISHKEDDRLIDTQVIGLMVWQCLDIEARELVPIIEILYKENLAGTGLCGDWEDVKESFEELRIDKINKRRNIFEKYDYYLKQWYYYSSKKDLEPEKDFYGDDFEEEEDDDMNFAPQNPVKSISEFAVKERLRIRTQPKVGRNAPCPCGSGKKFKRCCG